MHFISKPILFLLTLVDSLIRLSNNPILCFLFQSQFCFLLTLDKLHPKSLDRCSNRQRPNLIFTRKHSSRMCTTRLETIRASSFSDHHQKSLAGGEDRSPGLTFRRYPYHVTHPMKHLMLPIPPCEQTDACENITFPQLCLWAVKITY